MLRMLCTRIILCLKTAHSYLKTPYTQKVTQKSDVFFNWPAKPLVLFGIQLLVAHLMVEMTVRLLGLKPLPLQLLQAQVLARPLQLVLCWKLWQLLQLLWVMMLQQQLAVAQVQQDLQCLRYLLHWWHLPLQVSLVSQQQKDLALVLPWRWGSYHLGVAALLGKTLGSHRKICRITTVFVLIPFMFFWWFFYLGHKKKHLLLSMKYWLVNTDPLIMVYYIIPI